MTERGKVRKTKAQKVAEKRLYDMAYRLKKRNSKYPNTKSILKVLDGAARKYGLVEVRHAANKWASAQRERASLAKQRRILEQRLAEVSRKLT